MGYSSLSHPGNLPIRVLQYNIVDHVENFNKYINTMLQDGVIKDKIVAPGISIICSKEKIIPPYVSCEEKKLCCKNLF